MAKGTPAKGDGVRRVTAHLDAVPLDHLLPVEDRPAQLGRALVVPADLKRRAALDVVMHQHDRLALVHGAARLAQAVAALEVALGHEDLNHLRGTDVLF